MPNSVWEEGQAALDELLEPTPEPEIHPVRDRLRAARVALDELSPDPGRRCGPNPCPIHDDLVAGHHQVDEQIDEPGIGATERAARRRLEQLEDEASQAQFRTARESYRIRRVAAQRRADDPLVAEAVAWVHDEVMLEP